MWQMLQNDSPDDWVVATGETHTVKEFAELAFKHVELDWNDYITTSEKYHRPNEVGYLLGDPTKVKSKLGWNPETSFEELVKMMVEFDLELAKREAVLIEENLIKPTWENPN